MFARNSLELVLDGPLESGVQISTSLIESVKIQLAALPSSTIDFTNFTIGEPATEHCVTGNTVHATLQTDTHQLFVRAMVQVGPAGSSFLQAVLPSGVISLSSGAKFPATTITVPLELDGMQGSLL